MFKCGFKDCEKIAVCGLEDKSSGMKVNVCREHFKKMKGYPVEQDTTVLHLGIQEELVVRK